MSNNSSLRLKYRKRLRHAGIATKHDVVRKQQNEIRSGAELTLGRLIQDYRERAGISLRDLAEQIEVVPSMMSLFERDRGFPTYIALNKLAKLLGRPAVDLQRLDTRVRIHELRRLIEQSPELSGAFRFLLQEVQEGRITPRVFAEAILSARGRHY